MENNRIILERVKLLMKYETSKTLNENIVDNNIILENVIDEADAQTWEKVGQEFGTALKDVSSVEKAAIENILKDNSFGGIQGINGKITSFDELTKALENGTIKEAAIGKLKRGLLRSGNANLAQKSASAIANLGLKDGVDVYLNGTKEEIVNHLMSPNIKYSRSEAELIANEAIAQRGTVKSTVNTIDKTSAEDIAGGVGNVEKEIDAVDAGQGANVKGKNVKTVDEATQSLTIVINGDVVGSNINGVIGDAKKLKQSARTTKAGATKTRVPKTKGGGVATTGDVNVTGGVATGDGGVKPIGGDPAIIDTIEQDLTTAKPNVEENIKGGRWEKWKKAFPSLKGKWRYILGGAGLVLWYFYYKNSNDKKKILTFQPCVSALLDDDGSTIMGTTSGDPVIFVKNTGNKDYDSNGGLYFYTNGRVFYGNMKRKGSYVCNGQKIEVGAEGGSQTLSEATSEVTPQQMRQYVDDAASNIRGWVVISDLKNLAAIMHLLSGKTYKGKNAISQFLEIYNGTFGHNFVEMVNEVGTSTLGAEGYELKKEILNYLTTSASGDNNPHTGLSNLTITWDNENAGGSGGGDKIDNTKKDEQIQYHDCSNKDLSKGDTLEIGCISPLIKNIQDCLISKNIQLTGGADSKFGPSLSAYLNGKKVIDKAEYDKQMAICADQKVADTSGMGDDSAEYLNGQNQTTGTTTTPTTAEPELHHGPDSSQAPKEAPANVVAPSAPEETGEQLFKKWVGTYFRNKLGGKKQAIGQNRLFYKGPDLTQADFDKLNQYLQQNGYQLTNDQHAKRFGDKYVWNLNNQEQPAAAEPQQISEEFIKNIVGKHLRSKL